MTDHNKQLAARLRDHADGIDNVAAHEMEEDIRKAANIIENLDTARDMALGPRMRAAILHEADQCHDLPVKVALYELAGHTIKADTIVAAEAAIRGG